MENDKQNACNSRRQTGFLVPSSFPKTPRLGVAVLS
jgi:hypothetical protein